MNEKSFVNRRETDWQRLAFLCDQADSNLRKVREDDLNEFVRLYRRLSTDLAVARTRTTNLQLVDFLNDLTARAYGILYQAPRKPLFASIVDAVAVAAQTVRRNRWFLFASIGLFVTSIFFCFFVLKAYPDAKDLFIPKGTEQSFDMWKSGHFPGRSSSESAMMTGLYASHNPFVAILSGAIAASTFGVLTAMMIYTNGAMLGALLWYVQPAGNMDFVLSSILPHGVPEMSGILISGAAGFRMGWALINPGRYSRAQSMRAAGKDAITLLATSVVMMFIAAPIEGFFSFNPHVPGWVKLIVAGVSLAAWICFWTFFGRSKETAADTVHA